ncbi:MAG: hypothetical protein RI996_174 [Candidatus Parcubacteria bacterium]|jgi:hypothetical protein
MKIVSHLHIGLAFMVFCLVLVSVKTHTEAAVSSSVKSRVFYGRITTVIPCPNGTLITLKSGSYLIPLPPEVKIHKTGVTSPGKVLLGRYNPVTTVCEIEPPIPALGTVILYGTN